jgi:20S proteasome alpha/beta subunit
MPLHLQLLVLLILLLLIEDEVNATAAGTETLIGLTGDGFVLLAADSSLSAGSAALTSSDLDKIAVLSESMAAAAAGDAADADRLVGKLRALCSVARYENSPGSDVTYVDCSTSGISSMPRLPSASTMTVNCLAQAARSEIARRMRSSHPFSVCLLIAGMSADVETEPFSVAGHVQGQVRTATSSFLTDETVNTKERNHAPPTKGGSLQPALYWLDEYGALQRVFYGVHGYAASMLWSVLDRGYRDNMSLQEAVELLQECLLQLRTRYVINSQPSEKPQFCVKCIDATGCRLLDLTAAIQ